MTGRMCFIAYLPNKHLGVAIAWADLGHIAGQDKPAGTLSSINGALWWRRGMKRYTHVKYYWPPGYSVWHLAVAPRRARPSMMHSAGLQGYRSDNPCTDRADWQCPDIRPFFEETDLERFQSKLNEQSLFARSVGVPVDYTGDPMDKVHAGMDITEANFNRLVELLIDAMDETGIPHPIQNQLLARLAPLRAEML